MSEKLFAGIKNRFLQQVARSGPGATNLRVWCHRWRGVNIGKNVWIGYDCVLETSYPHLVSIGDNAVLSVRCLIIAHFHEQQGVVIKEDAFIGPGAIILPNVTIGRGAVVCAGSVVTTSVPDGTVVQGNPAKPMAKSKLSLGMSAMGMTMKEFLVQLRPLTNQRTLKASGSQSQGGLSK